ncbi:MAG: UxaA family hydrolase [Halobacteriaceae archaeon]
MKGAVHEAAALVLAEEDTVATALDDLAAGRTVPLSGDAAVTLSEPVEFGHKFALAAHDAGDPVRKYGEVIGRATAAIEPGEWVHTHNLESARGRGDLAGGSGGETRESPTEGGSS